MYAAHLLIGVVGVVSPVRFSEQWRNERDKANCPETGDDDQALTYRRFRDHFAIAHRKLNGHVSITQQQRHQLNK